MKKRYELRLIGVTYNQIESGVYALVLEEPQSGRRIPIVIGYPEAQAIECKLQEVVTPRPLTHDLICQIFDTFGLTLSCVEIHKLPSGVFAADLVIEDADGRLHRIDSRSSDAISIAIRAGAPIYTSAEVLEECSFAPHREGKDKSAENAYDTFDKKSDDAQDPVEDYSDSEIREMIAKYAAEENYEEAARLSAILKRRNDNNV